MIKNKQWKQPFVEKNNLLHIKKFKGFNRCGLAIITTGKIQARSRDDKNNNNKKCALVLTCINYFLNISRIQPHFRIYHFNSGLNPYHLSTWITALDS